jgi:hypothetical protein
MQAVKWVFARWGKAAERRRGAHRRSAGGFRFLLEMSIWMLFSDIPAARSLISITPEQAEWSEWLKRLSQHA